MCPPRLLFQCRYSGTSVEALVIDVNTIPPPLPVAGPGPLRVELRLANGQCLVKGCVEGKVFLHIKASVFARLALNVLFASCRRSGILFLLQ